MKKYLLGAIAIIIAASLWALDGLLLRPNLYTIDITVVVFMEHFIGFLIMTVFLFPFFKEIPKLKKQDWIAFFLVAIFGGAIGTIAITKAFFMAFEQGANLSVILLLQKLQPVFAVILAIILLKEKPKPFFFVCALFALIGSYILTFGLSLPDLSLTDVTLIPAILSVIAAACFGSSTVFSKKAVSRVSFYIGTYLRFALTTGVMAVIILMFSRTSGFLGLTSNSLLLLLLIAFTTGGGALFLYYYGLKKVPASNATMYELAFPIVSVAGEWIIHGNLLSVSQIIGGCILVISVTALILYKSRK
ncbi:MAG: DMT family transporter [Candidatus Cloacimonetes bacterium]|nr:DMT family transporter [Candidatus Cloacimonadota bacterium]